MTADPLFHVHAETAGATTRVVVVGELDASTAPELTRAVEALRPGADDCVLDMGGVTFIDSSGVRALLQLTSIFDDGRPLRLVDVTPPVARVLTIAGVDRLLQINRIGEPTVGD